LKILLSVQPIKYPLTGIGRYTYEIAKELKINPMLDDVCYINENTIIENIPEADDIEITVHNYMIYNRSYKAIYGKK
jgi:hypothetical protein